MQSILNVFSTSHRLTTIVWKNYRMQKKGRSYKFVTPGSPAKGVQDPVDASSHSVVRCFLHVDPTLETLAY
jgi:hypothetical protein